MLNTSEGDPKFFFGALIIILVALFIAAHFLLPAGFYSDNFFDFGKGGTPVPPTGPQAPDIGGDRTSGGCIITGCSSQVCADEEVITTCEFRAEYACYRSARCERQASGECGWTLNEDVRECLAEASR